MSVYRYSDWAHLAPDKTKLIKDEIANMNFPYGDIVHVLQNTIDSCINSATDRRRYVLEHRFTKHITVSICGGIYAPVYCTL